MFDAGKRQIREVLRPRTEVEFLCRGRHRRRGRGDRRERARTRGCPVYQDSYDNVIGFVHIRDLLGPGAPDRATLVEQVVRPIKFLPISKTVLAALSEMRRERAHMAIVADEYGGTAGIVTLEDLVEELIGDIRDEYDSGQAVATKLPRGEVEADGLLNLDEFAEQTGIELPEGPYETVAGYVLAALGELPAAGDSVKVPGYTITVTEMDGRRIARLRVTPTPRPAPGAAAAGRAAGRLRARPRRHRRSSKTKLCTLRRGREAVHVSGPGAFDTVLVVDFGAQYAQLIARRVRECHVYSEIVPSSMPVSEMLAEAAQGDHPVRRAGVGLRGGAPAAPAGLFDAGVPVLGICYGHQVLVRELGGTVERTGAAEYGGTPLDVVGRRAAAGAGSARSSASGCRTVTRPPPRRPVSP